MPVRRSRLGLLRHPDFMKLWTGQTISQFGTQVSGLAIPLIAALFLNVSAFEFSLIATVEFLPFILLSLPAGVWVDRLRRRPILIVGDLGRGIALLSIPLAYELHLLTIWQLYAVGFLNGCLTVFFDVSYQSYLPSLVERDEILEGNAKLQVSASSAQVLGPGIAGVLIGVISAPIAVIADSMSFFASALFVFRIRKPEPPPQVHATVGGKRPGMRAEVKVGLQYVLKHPYLRYVAGSTAISNLFGNMIFGILVLYLARDAGVQPALLGLAFSLASIGFLFGALTANRIGTRIGVGPTIIASLLVSSASVFLIAVAPTELVLPLATVSVFIGGFAGTVFNINQVSFRQAITPPRMQGRMNATMRFLIWGTIPVGTLVGGALGSTIGLRATIWIGATGGMIAVLPLLFSPFRSLRVMPEPVSDDGSASMPGADPETAPSFADELADAAAGGLEHGPTTPVTPVDRD